MIKFVVQDQNMKLSADGIIKVERLKPFIDRMKWRSKFRNWKSADVSLDD